MSYCRFSSEDFTCDVYVYEHCDGGWQIHIAGNRFVPKEPMPPKVSPQDDPQGYMRRQQTLMRIIDECDRVPIELPHAGEGFNEPTPVACADRLEYLRGLGYVVPQYAIDALREEQREMDEQGEEGAPIA